VESTGRRHRRYDMGGFGALLATALARPSDYQAFQYASSTTAQAPPRATRAWNFRIVHPDPDDLPDRLDGSAPGGMAASCRRRRCCRDPFPGVDT